MHLKSWEKNSVCVAKNNRVDADNKQVRLNVQVACL